MQDAVLAAFLVIDHELDADSGAARPTGDRAGWPRKPRMSLGYRMP